jgi:hypothetical protein
MEVRLKPDQENNGAGVRGYRRPLPFIPGSLPGLPSSVSRRVPAPASKAAHVQARDYCRKGVTTASNSPAGMAPTLR